MKRIVPILLCIVMVLSMLPLTASAYGLINGGTIIVKGVTAPVAGDTASVSGITAESSNLALYEAPYWCDAGGNKYTGVFKPNVTYYLELHVSGKSDVGYINDTTSITLEISGNYKQIEDKGYAGNYHIYHVWYYSVKHYGGFDANYAPHLTITPENLTTELTPNDIQITPAEADYALDALITFSKKGGNEIAFDQPFEAGERYTVTFTLTVKNSNYTAFDDGIIAFINGDSCDGTVYAGGKTAGFTYEFPNAPKAFINSVALTQISAPVVGGAPQQTQFASSTPHVNVSLLGWREGTAQTGADVAAFEANKTYTLWLRLNADAPYELALADKSAVTANAGTVATLTTGWQGDNGSYYTVGIEFKTPADPAEFDLGTCTVDLSNGPILTDTIPEVAKEEVFLLGLGGYVTPMEGSRLDFDKDGHADLASYDEDGKSYWKADPDTNLSGTYILDIYELFPEMANTYAANSTSFYSKIAFVFATVQYTVTFDANGHGTAPEAQTVEAGKTAVKPADPTEAGWKFDGWFTDKACTAAYDFSAPVTADLTLYAKWTKDGELVNPFTDVHESDYFYDAVLWAANANPQVTAGTSPTTFSPNATCTRAQVVTFLWRAKGCPEPQSSNNPFTDVASSEYYYKAVLWAVENEITAGTTATTFSPNAGCTRAQVVTFLWRAEGKPQPQSSNNPFTDVASSEYYYNAVLWAVEKNITKGTSDTTFSPDDTCTRGQIVTFLYRDLG